MEREKQSREPAAPDASKVASPDLAEGASSTRKEASEAARLAALHRTGLLDSPPEPEFDRFTMLAARLLSSPIAVLAMLNEHRAFLKSATGLTEPLASSREWPLSHSFCKHIVASGGPITIEDSREDPLVRENLAVRESGIVAYLGVPVRAPGDIIIASLCVMDFKPRHWSAEDIAAMQKLADSVSTEIALRWHLDESRRSSEQFQAFVNTSPAVMYLLDVHELRGLFASKAAGALVGRTPEEIVKAGASFLPDNMHPEDYARWAGYYLNRLRHLSDGEKATFECRMLMPDGSWRWILTTEVVFSRDATGAVQQILGSAIDITARKEAEKALRESEKRLEVAVSGAELGTWDWHAPTGSVIYNERWAEMLGYTLDEIEPHIRQWEKLVHPDDRKRVHDEMQLHVERHTPLFCVEHRLKAKNGTWKWIITSGKVLERDAEDRPLRAAGIHLDINEQKIAEAAAREADRKLARILESINEACSSLDAEWRFTYVNPKWETFFGWQRHKVIGRTLWEVFPETRGTTIEENYRRAMSERVAVRYEVFSPVVNRWLEIRTFPAADGGLSTFVLDVHERKLAEETLLEQDRRKDEFIAMLGHELRNPLAAIHHAFAMSNDDSSPETFMWAKGVVQRQSTHLGRLVNQLLDAARITEGKIELHKQRVDITTVLDQAMDEARPLVVERRQEVTTSYEHNQLWVDGDPDRLEQVFSNLLNNAAKYTHPDGHIWIEANQVQTGAGSADCEVVITIRDNGVGIIPEKLAQMFEVFVQGERSLARSEGGLGLGLTIVKRLTEMHGGHVTANSDGPGQGSTFIVHLPAAAISRPAEPRNVPTAPQKPVPHRVLVVDDVIDSAEGLARLLKRQGHIVEVATDGPHACEQAHRFVPDVVLLDIGMPGMDGYEVARYLRHDECCADSFIVALTGYGQEEDRRRAMDAGFDDHLVKPVDLERLKRLVGDAPCLK